MLKTQRLTLYPVSNAVLASMIEKESDSELRQAYTEMLKGCLNNPLQRIWYTVWVIEKSDTHQWIGDFAFKGIDEAGKIEIGYGLKPEHQKQGYMREALAAIVQWARIQPEVRCIEAETEPDNHASRNVLLSVGFLPNGIMGQEGPRYAYPFLKDHSR